MLTIIKNNINLHMLYLNIYIYCYYLCFSDQVDGDLHGKSCSILRNSTAYKNWESEKDEASYSLFIKAGKWIIIGLSAFSLLREVSKCQ